MTPDWIAFVVFLAVACSVAGYWVGRHFGFIAGWDANRDANHEVRSK